MSNGAVIAVIVVVLALLLVAGAYFLLQNRKRQQLRDQFGPEYDRTVADSENRREAEQELEARRARHDELDIRALTPEERERYATEWSAVQERFVESPETAVTEADQLVTSLMSDRGYPTGGYEDQVAQLSVEHGQTLDHYRTAHEISERHGAGDATTEDLRQAMVHYRALFTDLLDHGTDTPASDTPVPDAHGTETPAPDREGTPS